MRELFENGSSKNPVEAARQSVRRSQRKRFYDTATAVTADDGFAVRLDGKPVRTPAGRVLAAPTLALAQAIAAEWNAQRDIIDPGKMPLTRLVNSIIDGVCDRPGPVAAEVGKYLSSDLVCYRAVSPKGLVERQAEAWDPILKWSSETLGADFSVGEGIIHVTQPAQALAAARAAIPGDPWRLGAVNSVTTLTGSALIALALASGRLTAEAAWQAANVDEDWNIEQWGGDDLALERRALRFAELQAAATVLKSLS
jgi:chaperone required for assembly of F1-ATPase